MSDVIRVWWHCLWRMFVPDHRWLSFAGDHQCECGYPDE